MSNINGLLQSSSAYRHILSPRELHHQIMIESTANLKAAKQHFKILHFKILHAPRSWNLYSTLFMCYSWDVNLQAGHYLPTLCGLRGNWIDTGSSGWRSSRLFPWQSYMLSVDTSELTCKCNLSLFICIKFLSKNLLLFSSFYHRNLFSDNLHCYC